MNIEFIDLKSQQIALSKQINEKISSVLESGKFILGPEVGELEKQLADYVGAKYCVSVANGTDALQLALMALKIKPGDYIITTPFTFFATVEVIRLLGAVPIFVDVDSDTFNMDPQQLENTIAKSNAEGKTISAVIVVDLFGLPANYNSINKICHKYNIKLIEDGAQGFGGMIENDKACSFGDINTTSFFPAKPLGCYGDGGAVFTDNKEFAEVITSLRFHGKGADKYDNVRVGLNSRLDTIQAAILLTKLSVFEDEIKEKQKLADFYSQSLSAISRIQTPIIPKGYRSSWAQYTLKVEQRTELQTYLKEKNIPTAVYYPNCMHNLTALQDLGIKETFQNSEKLSETVLSLPMHAYMPIEQKEYIVQAIKSFYA